MGKSELSCDCEIIHYQTVEKVKGEILDSQNLDLMVKFYKAFADNTRIKIINALLVHEMCVCDLAVLLNMTKSATSHQLRFLRNQNIISSRKNGKIVFYKLSDDHVEQMFKLCHEHTEEAL